MMIADVEAVEYSCDGRHDGRHVARKQQRSQHTPYKRRLTNALLCLTLRNNSNYEFTEFDMKM